MDPIQPISAKLMPVEIPAIKSNRTSDLVYVLFATALILPLFFLPLLRHSRTTSDNIIVAIGLAVHTFAFSASEYLSIVGAVGFHTLTIVKCSLAYAAVLYIYSEDVFRHTRSLYFIMYVMDNVFVAVLVLTNYIKLLIVSRTARHVSNDILTVVVAVTIYSLSIIPAHFEDKKDTLSIVSDICYLIPSVSIYNSWIAQLTHYKCISLVVLNVCVIVATVIAVHY
jgi:hypothetical protein